MWVFSMGYRKLNEIQFFKYALGTPFERKVVTHLFLSTPNMQFNVRKALSTPLYTFLGILQLILIIGHFTSGVQLDVS